MSQEDYYVYLLVEERPDDEQVFYVGKGWQTRAAAHLQEYVHSITAGGTGSHELAAAGAIPPPISEVADGSSALMTGPSAEEHAKLRRIRDAYAAGHEVRVDLLRTNLAEASAYLVESSVIDAIGLERLTNLVHGHDHGRIPALAAARVLDAEPIAIDVPAFQVVVKGLWGGGNSLAGLLGAHEVDIWNNARQSWAISSAVRGQIDAAAATSEPFVLVAVAQGPTSTYGGIVLGVWEIAGTERASDRVDRANRVTDGWAFVAAATSPRLEQLRTRYLHRRSTHPRQSGPTRIG